MPDEMLWPKTQMEGRLLITTDKGFAQHRNESHHGIIVVRLKKPSQAKIQERVMRAFNQFAESEWKGLLVVMRDVVQAVWQSQHDDMN
jgi:hypothetical protein